MCKNPFTCLLSEQCVISVCCEIGDIIKHIYYVIDINNSIPFPVEKSIKFNYICDLTSELFSIIFGSIIEFISAMFGLSTFVIRPKTIDIFSFAMHLTEFKKWKRLSNHLELHLPDATEADIQRDDCCIICRLQMNIKEGKNNQNAIKKLPCGHCYHQSCLQQWIMHQKKCPLCQYDLAQLIEPNKRQHNEDLFNFGYDLIGKFNNEQMNNHNEQPHNEVQVLENYHQEIMSKAQDKDWGDDNIHDSNDNNQINNQNHETNVVNNEDSKNCTKMSKNLYICSIENASYESFDCSNENNQLTKE